MKRSDKIDARKISCIYVLSCSILMNFSTENNKKISYYLQMILLINLNRDHFLSLFSLQILGRGLQIIILTEVRQFLPFKKKQTNELPIYSIEIMLLTFLKQYFVYNIFTYMSIMENHQCKINESYLNRCAKLSEQSLNLIESCRIESTIKE